MTDHDLTWFAAVARPGRVFDAVGEFVGAGLEAFTPREMRQRRTTAKRGMRETYAVPACGPYFFIGTAGCQPRIDGHKHVIDLLRVDGDAARIDHGSITRMRKIDGILSTDIRYGGMSPRALRVGDEVTIGDNPWGAVKITALSKGLVTVTFKAFGSERQTTVKRSMVDAAMEAA